MLAFWKQKRPIYPRWLQKDWYSYAVNMYLLVEERLGKSLEGENMQDIHDPKMQAQLQYTGEHLQEQPLFSDDAMLRPALLTVAPGGTRAGRPRGHSRPHQSFRLPKVKQDLKLFNGKFRN